MYRHNWLIKPAIIYGFITELYRLLGLMMRSQTSRFCSQTVDVIICFAFASEGEVIAVSIRMTYASVPRQNCV